MTHAKTSLATFIPPDPEKIKTKFNILGITDKPQKAGYCQCVDVVVKDARKLKAMETGRLKQICRWLERWRRRGHHLGLGSALHDELSKRIPIEEYYKTVYV